MEIKLMVDITDKAERCVNTLASALGAVAGCSASKPAPPVAAAPEDKQPAAPTPAPVKTPEDKQPAAPASAAPAPAPDLKAQARAIMDAARKRLLGDDYADAAGRDAALGAKFQAVNAKFQALATDTSLGRTKRPTELTPEELEKFRGRCECLEWNEEFARYEEGLPF